MVNNFDNDAGFRFHDLGTIDTRMSQEHNASVFNIRQDGDVKVFPRRQGKESKALPEANGKFDFDDDDEDEEDHEMKKQDTEQMICFYPRE